jgi:hypothetical protein
MGLIPMGVSELGMGFGGFMEKADQVMNATGVNTYWNAGFVIDPLRQGRDTVGNFLEDSYSGNSNTYSNLGYGVGQIAGSVGMAASFILPTMGHAFNSSAEKGMLSKIGFLKGKKIPHLIKAGIIGTAASIVGGMALSKAFSTVGSLFDQAHQAGINRRKIHYDNSYYNTSKYEQSAYQTIGSAMGDYTTKLQSISRLYHSRG